MDRLGATFRKFWIVNMLNNRPLIKNREFHSIYEIIVFAAGRVRSTFYLLDHITNISSVLGVFDGKSII